MTELNGIYKVELAGLWGGSKENLYVFEGKLGGRVSNLKSVSSVNLTNTISGNTNSTFALIKL